MKDNKIQFIIGSLAGGLAVMAITIGVINTNLRFDLERIKSGDVYADTITYDKLADDVFRTVEMELDSGETVEVKLVEGKIDLGYVAGDVKLETSDGKQINAKVIDYSPRINIENGSVTEEKLSKIVVDKLNKIIETDITIPDRSVAHVKIKEDTITSEELADGSVSTSELLDASITSGKLQSGIIGTSHLGNYVVKEFNIADNSVSTRTLLTGAVTNTKIADGAITEVKLATGAVTSNKIADATITDVDISATASIAWTKLNKTGSSIADLTTRNAVDVDVDNALGYFSTATVQDALEELYLADSNYVPLTGGNVTGALNIAVPTATTSGLVIQTTDDDPTNDLFRLLLSDGSVLTNIDVEGKQFWNVYETSASPIRRGVINYGTPSGNPGIVLTEKISGNDYRFDMVNAVNDFTFGFNGIGSGTDALTINRYSGRVGVNTTNAQAQLHIKPYHSSYSGLRIDSATGQTANLFEINSDGGSGGDLFAITSTGGIVASRGTANTNLFLGNDAGNTTASAIWNTAIGSSALSSLTSGNANVAIGINTGSNIDTGAGNMILGALAGQAVTSGSANVLIGYGADTSAGNISNSIAVGRGATATKNNQFVLGSSGYPINEIVIQSTTNVGIYSNNKFVMGSNGNIGTGSTNAILSLDNGQTTGNSLYIAGNGAGNAIRFDDTGGTDRNAIFVSNNNFMSIGNINYSATQIIGNLGVGLVDNNGLGSAPSARFHVNTGSSTTIGQVIQASAGQTANLFEINSDGGSGGDLLRITSDGQFSNRVTEGTSQIKGIRSDITISTNNIAGSVAGQFILNLTNAVNSRGSFDNGMPAALVASVFDNVSGTNVSNAAAIIANPDLRLASGLDNFYGFAFNTGNIDATNIQSVYGIYLEDINAGTTNNYAILTNAGNVVFNEGGDANTDFRVEGSGQPNALFVDGTNGRVGIGTNNPSRQLHIVSSSSVYTNFYVQNTGTGSAVGQTAVESTGGDPKYVYTVNGVTEWAMGLDNSDADKFKISNSFNLGTNDVFTIDSSGQVGIGTANPYLRLDVAGDIRIQGANKLYFGGTGSGDYDVELYRSAADTLYTPDTLSAATLQEGSVDVSRWQGVLSSAPASPQEGDMYFNSTDSKVYIYANATWVALN